MPTQSKIIPCLWFDGEAGEAADFYVSLLPDSHVDRVTKSPSDYPSGKTGDVLTVEFTLAGQNYMGLNGGPLFKFTEALSLQIMCDDQAEVDRLWKALSAHPENEQCGWVKDRYGLSWQIVPRMLSGLLAGADAAASKRAMEAMMQMKKLDIAALQKAYDGG
ncbi:MAG: VOC family protein [Pseudomonadota bacterium]|nr:VOC family protein [Pseudomonadota bacterium]